MHSLSDLSKQRYSYSQRRNFSSSIAIENKLSKEEEDQILDSYPQLITEEYRSWFVIRLRAIGKAKFVEKADRSIKYGKNPRKMFVYLVR